MFSALLIKAQLAFTEGVIVYDVKMNNNNSEQKGTLTITIKGNKMKRELKFKGGLDNVILMDLEKLETSSYIVVGTGKYVSVKKRSEIEEENKKFVNAKYSETGQKKQIVNFDCNEVNITYANGKKNSVYYATEISPIPAIIAMFPELKGMPMEYRIATSGNNEIILTAKSFERKPIDNSEFLPLKGYKLIDASKL
jgi:hypothetical protein